MQIGVIGLSTMGANIARNAMRNGADVVVYNRTTKKADDFLAAHKTEGAVKAAKTFKNFVAQLTAPRVVLLMVKSDGVDDVLKELLPLLAKGDTVIDGGNSHYRDTERRTTAVAKKGMLFVGMGISGGADGALKGPSMMPGGDQQAVEALLPFLQTMAAQDGSSAKKSPETACVAYMGPGGSGHFVKTVHNGIEYAVMQIIAESYHLLGTVGKMSNAQIADLYAAWSVDGHLSSFLMDVSIRALRQHDPKTGESLVDMIQDRSAQKGTGKWTVEAAFEYGVSVSTIAAAVDARIVSGAKEFRVQQAERDTLHSDDSYRLDHFTDAVRMAMELSIINAYAQGFQLLASASQAEQWQLNLSEIARIWRGGCIIRSALLPHFQQVFAGDSAATDVLRDRFGASEQLQWRHVVALGALHAIPLPAIGAALTYYDAYRTERLPQNLIAAQRDMFGAHGYERVDETGVFHTEWGV